jgi:hypothetical protein
VAESTPRGTSPSGPSSWRTPDSPYTVYADTESAGGAPAAAPARAVAPRRFDPLALLVGLVALAVAGLAVVAPGVLAATDPRWVLAGAAVVVGGGVLLTTMRRRRG